MHVARSPCLARARYVAECVNADMELEELQHNSTLSAPKASFLPFFKKEKKKNKWVAFFENKI
jgi:hypothetical protein